MPTGIEHPSIRYTTSHMPGANLQQSLSGRRGHEYVISQLQGNDMEPPPPVLLVQSEKDSSIYFYCKNLSH